MARPDLSAERTEQILDAFSRCIARRGLDATSLEDVAEEAGVRRSIIRHYIGNRNDLIEVFIDRLMARFRRDTEDMRAWFAVNSGVEKLPDYLFWDEDGSKDEMLVLEPIFTAARRDPALAGRLSDWFEDFVDAVDDVLRTSFPEAKKDEIRCVAYGIVAIYNNHQSMAALGAPNRHRSVAQQAAGRLLASLESCARR